MKDLLGNMISDSLEEEFGIEDPNKVGKDMTIVEPTDVDTLKEGELVLKPEDVLEDYLITRVTLQETLDQSKEILKTASELLKDNPNPAIIKVIPNLINAINNTSESLFDIHIKIAEKINEEKDDEDDQEQFTTNEIINNLNKK